MSSLETLRTALVAGAAIAAVVAALAGMWLPAAILAFAVLVHGVATPLVRRQAGARPAPGPPSLD